MAIRKYLRRKRKRPVEGNGQQHFFKAEGEQHETAEGSSFFSPAEKTQSRMKMSQPGDPQELEAERMADKVSRSPVAPASSSSLQRAPKKEEEKLGRVAKEEEIHKKDEEEKMHKKGKEEEEKVHKKGKMEEEKVSKKGKEEELHKKTAEEKEKDSIATSPAGAKAAMVHPSVVSRIDKSKGTGSRLPEGAVKEMSSNFGYDFSNVRIHTNAESENLSDQVHAQAFTHGQDIYFNKGQYNPSSPSGKKLLAHELTHVVQQRKGEMPPVQRQQVPGISTPIPKDFKLVKKLKKLLYATGKVNGVDVVVRPDLRGEVEEGKSGHTSLQMKWELPRMVHLDGKIIKVKGNPVVHFFIQTTYKKGVDTSGPSAYGKGTTPEDKAAGHTTLSFHEASHGTGAMVYLENHALPKFDGQVGMMVADYSAAEEKFNQEMNDYYAALQKANVEEVDCTGTKEASCMP